MKKQNGFIATSLVYTFFLGFVTLFVGMIAIYLKNRVYLDKLEYSSKNSLYIRDMINTNNFSANITYEDNTNITNKTLSFKKDTIFTYESTDINVAKCDLIYLESGKYYLEGCVK